MDFPPNYLLRNTIRNVLPPPICSPSVCSGHLLEIWESPSAVFPGQGTAGWAVIRMGEWQFAGRLLNHQTFPSNQPSSCKNLRPALLVQCRTLFLQNGPTDASGVLADRKWRHLSFSDLRSLNPGGLLFFKISQSISIAAHLNE